MNDNESSNALDRILSAREIPDRMPAGLSGRILAAAISPQPTGTARYSHGFLDDFWSYVLPAAMAASLFLGVFTGLQTEDTLKVFSQEESAEVLTLDLWNEEGDTL